MWRSLFYSVGIGLFALGLQALVVDYVVIPKNTKVQKLVRKILSDDNSANANSVSSQAVAGGFDLQTQTNRAAQQVPNQNFNQGYGGFGGGTVSRFGPSRFDQSQFSGPALGMGYGGSRVTPQGGSSNYNDFRGQASSTQLAGYRMGDSNTNIAKKPVQMQNFKIREWMPWSLLASGAIIFLYTHTIHRRGFQD